MAIARNFSADSGIVEAITLSWDQPLNFNNTLDELIITRTKSHFPVELENTVYPNTATDIRPIQIFRGRVIQSTATSSSVATLVDSAASFSVSPKLTGRLVRDANSRVFRILDNTATTLTLDTNLTPATGPYVILADFPQTTRVQQNFENDIRSSVGAGFVNNLVQIVSGELVVSTFQQDELANLIFVDGAGIKKVIKSNTLTTVTFFDSSYIPVLGSGAFILNSFAGNTQPLPYTDNFLEEFEAAARLGTGLEADQYYYYTAFTKTLNVNVAQATFGPIDSGVSTQDSAISVADRGFGTLLYQYWPSIARDLDTTEDLEDLMKVFGFQMQEAYTLIKAYKLQDTDNVFVNALPALADQTGLPSVGFSIGADTLRRISRDMIPCWKLKGTKEGIGIFIKKITTWDITNGTGDWAGAITDFLPNVEALRFFDPNIGSTNTRITQTEPNFISGGRFAQGLPGIVIPGFFTFREFVITLPNIALEIGATETLTIANGRTTITDTTKNFGDINSLVGNFIIPNEEEVNDIFQIVANTSTSITLNGIVNNKETGGKYIVLSPLNKNRFLILNSLLPIYIPFGTKPGFSFV